MSFINTNSFVKSINNNKEKLQLTYLLHLIDKLASELEYDLLEYQSLLYKVYPIFNKLFSKEILLKLNIELKDKHLLLAKMSKQKHPCEAILKSGKRKGESCNKNTYSSSDGTTWNVCKTHLNNEIAKIISTSTTTVEKQLDDKKENENENENEEEEKDDNFCIIIKKNKFGNFVINDTNLILKSSSEKYIVATEGNNGIWQPLTRQDIKLCKKLKLRHKIIPLDFRGENNIKSSKYFKSLVPSFDDNTAATTIDDNQEVDTC